MVITIALFNTLMSAALSKVRVPLTFAVLAANTLSTSMLPPLTNSKPVAVIFCNSAVLISNPVVDTVSPNPIPFPSLSVIVVEAVPLSIPVPERSRSSAVIVSALSVVSKVTDAAKVNVPTPSSASLSATKSVAPAVVRLLLIVIPSAASKSNAPAPTMPAVAAASKLSVSAEATVTPAAKLSVPESPLSMSESIASAPVSVLKSTLTATPPSASTARVLNTEAAVAKVINPVASRVVVPDRLLLFAAVMLSTVTPPTVAISKPVAVMFCNSAPVMFNPFVIAVSPNPTPVPSLSVIVVVVDPLLRVDPNAMSLAVIEIALFPALTAATVVKVPSLSAPSVSASTVKVPLVVKPSLSVTPSAAFNVRFTPAIPPVVASKVKLPPEAKVNPSAMSMSSSVSDALFASPSIVRFPAFVVIATSMST